MPSAIAKFNDKQILTATARKSKELVAISNEAAEEKKAMENWIKRFDELFVALCKSEQGDKTTDNVSKGKQDDEFSVTLDTKDYKPEDVELVVDTNNKLIVKGRREVKTEDDIYDEEFNETFDLPCNVDDEEISLTQDKSGYLVIKAPLWVDDANQAASKEEHKTNDSQAIVKSDDSHSQEWSQLFDELFVPLVKSIERKD